MLEYIAGIFDSEGHVRLRPGKEQLISEASIGMTDKEPIEIIAKLFDNKMHCDSRESLINRKPLYYLTFGPNTGIVKFLNSIVPFLNEKRKSARIILEYLNLDINTRKLQKEKYLLEYKNSFHYSRLNEPLYISYPYLAGIIDGDGCISCIFNNKNSNPSVRITLEQCYFDIAEYLYNQYKGNLYFRKIKSENHREKICWTLSKDDSIVSFISNIIDFLILKKKRASRVMLINKYRESLNKFIIDRNIEFVRFSREEINEKELLEKSNGFYNKYMNF